MNFNNEQFTIKVLSKDHVAECVDIYIDAYLKDPWNEKYNFDSVYRYIQKYLNLNSFLGFVLIVNDKIVGEMLGLVMPTTSRDYYRVEDFCISPQYQNKGFGSEFIQLVKEYLKNKSFDNIILNTNGTFPSFIDYLKLYNNF